MIFYSSASSNSCWRGYEYYKNKKVVNIKKLNENEYISNVFGSNGELYNVHININHPKQSLCDCAFANDKKVICKHMIATYFSINPNEADKYLNDIESAEEEYENYQQELYERVENYIYNKMTKKDLQNSLSFILNYAPEWVYDRFVRDNDLF